MKKGTIIITVGVGKMPSSMAEEYMVKQKNYIYDKTELHEFYDMLFYISPDQLGTTFKMIPYE